jgi:hypothetical protein
LFVMLFCQAEPVKKKVSKNLHSTLNKIVIITTSSLDLV